MIIIDVNFNILKRIKKAGSTTRYMVLEKSKQYDIYVLLSNVLYRSVYDKQGNEQDTLFFEHTLADYVVIDGIHQVNEKEWQDWAISLNNKIDDIYNMFAEFMRVKNGA